MEHIDTPNSSNIKFVEWENNTLYVEFKQGGARYAYSGVSEEAFRLFESVESAGKYFTSEIKNNYPYKKIRG